MFNFILNSILIGFALAMDAFSCSISDGLSLGDRKGKKYIFIPLTFAIFQTIMPLIGYVCVTFLSNAFSKFYKWVPYIALILLSYLGIKMIIDGIKKDEEEEVSLVTPKLIILQGIATSIDALSVGFTISTYTIIDAIIASIIIGVVTFVICFMGVYIGKKVSSLTSKATIFGGVILILIGLEIFVKGVILG